MWGGRRAAKTVLLNVHISVSTAFIPHNCSAWCCVIQKSRLVGSHPKTHKQAKSEWHVGGVAQQTMLNVHISVSPPSNPHGGLQWKCCLIQKQELVWGLTQSTNERKSEPACGEASRRVISPAQRPRQVTTHTTHIIGLTCSVA
jgi:hypothetical protein